MLQIPSSVHRATLGGLIAFHILIIIASNYLVQLPITLFGWHTTWGAFSFPFIFLATDLTVRLLGKGELTSKVAFKVAGVTGGARAAIEGLGGSIELPEPDVATGKYADTPRGKTAAKAAKAAKA